MAGNCSFFCLKMTLYSASPSHGRVPVSISHATSPRLYTSERAFAGAPSICSGDMYAGVPMAAPVIVKRESNSLECAMPKSLNNARPVPTSMKIFSGFTSRCTTPRACANANASATSLSTRSARSASNGPSSITACFSVRPGTSCITSARPPSRRRFTACTVTMFGCCKRATVRASRVKRAIASSAFAANLGRTTLMATSRNRARSRARYTTALPPRPSSPKSVYSSSRSLTSPSSCASIIGCRRLHADEGWKEKTQRLLKVKSTSPISIRSPSVSICSSPLPSTRPLCATGFVCEKLSRCHVASAKRSRACERLTV